MGKGKAARAKTRVLFIIGIIPALIVLAFVTASVIAQDRAKRVAVSGAAERTEQLLRLELDQEAGAFRAAMDALAVNPALLRAMNQGDGAALRQTVRPLFDRLHEEQGISYLNFTRADRSQILRMEGSERTGQVVDRLNLFDAAEGGALPYGLDLDAFGTVTFRVVAPWRDSDGHLIGFMELGRDVEPLIDSLHRVLGLEVLVLVHKDLLDRDRWEEGERLAGRQRSWDELATSVAVIQTLQTVPMPVGLMLEDGSRSREVTVSPDKKRRTYVFTVRPLVDIGERPIGEIVVLKDVTDTTLVFRQTFLALAVFSALIALLGFLHSRAVLRTIVPKDEPRSQRTDRSGL